MRLFRVYMLLNDLNKEIPDTEDENESDIKETFLC
jgi:hypothetical protein